MSDNTGIRGYCTQPGYRETSGGRPNARAVHRAECASVRWVVQTIDTCSHQFKFEFKPRFGLLITTATHNKKKEREREKEKSQLGFVLFIETIEYI